MRRATMAETGSDRVALAKDAGMGRVSLFGILAGTLVAYGGFVVLLAIAAAIADAVDVQTRVAFLNWEELGTGGGLIVAAVLFIAYLFGGYVAGRMARRAGALNGFLVFVMGVLVAVLVAALVNLLADGDDILANLRNVGIPTTGSEWGDAGTVAGIASLVAIVVGPILGGLLGERWHGKLMSKAMDPGVGRSPGPQYQPAPPPPSNHEEATRPHEPHRPGQPDGGRQPAVGEQPAAPGESSQSAWGASRPWARQEPEPGPQPAAQEPGPAAREPEQGGPRVTRRVRTNPPRNR